MNTTINKFFLKKSLFSNNFNKVIYKNFYFQESKHGAGDVKII